MFKNLSIRTRLTGWYFISVTLIVVGMGVASCWAMRASLYSMIDLEFQRRIHNSITALTENGFDKSGHRLVNCVHTSQGIGLSRIFTSDGQPVCSSDDLIKMELVASAPVIKPGKLTIRNVQTPHGDVRLGAALVYINGSNWIIEWGEPLELTQHSLRMFTRLMLFTAPLLIGLCVLTGSAISRRALAPVDLIIRDARSIRTGNLSERLSVPPARDELRRLSETLNSMLERIERSVRSIQQFTADASHELRSPITVIRAATGYCLGRERSPEEVRVAMQRIDREAAHTTQLLDDLLLLARFDAQLDPRATSSADLADAAREAIERITPLAHENEISLTADIPQGPLWIREGYDPVERLIFILLDNAVKYTPALGQIHLRLSVNGKLTQLEVTDTGIGIAPEDLPHLFDRFWRADKVRSRQMGGTGLGLSIARTIVRQCGGSIRVKSEPGRGSSFLVEIPLLDTCAETAGALGVCGVPQI